MDQQLRRTYIWIRNAINTVRLLGFNGFSILIRTILGSRSCVKVHIGGQSMELRLNTTDLRTLLQIYWNQEYKFSLASEPKVVLDCGANVGYSSLYFASRYPEAQIICVEPHPENFLQLKRNTASCKRIKIVQAAIWHKNEHLGLWDPAEGHWGFRVESPEKPAALNHISIEGVTLEALMKQFNLAYIDLLKLDIEGSEKEVFENSEAWIGSVGAIVAELHDKYRTGCARAFYNATNEFTQEFRLGENILILRSPLDSAPAATTQ